MHKILSLESLKIGYTTGKQSKLLLPPLTASANEGELIALIGRNGIGKSTMLRTLAGLQTALGGDIFYDDKNIANFSRMDLAQKVGYISTEIVKVTNMTVYDLVALGRFPHTNWIGKIDENNDKVIMNAIENTGMSDLKSRFVSELSDGERQRAMIARILAQDTGIMIMDEPTAFLDIGSKYEILHLMHVLSRERNKTIIFSTHDLSIAISQSDKIWLLTDASMREGAPEDLMIDGAFDHLFESSQVKFNSENGTFSFVSENMGSIYIEGVGIRRIWTEKAINRAGFSVSSIKSIPCIEVPAGDNTKWKLITRESSFELDSIYELVSCLFKVPINSV